MTHDELDPVWKALSDPTRRSLLDLLNDRPLTTGELCSHFHLTRFAVMKHLAVLEEAGLITAERRGRERWNHLNRLPLARIYTRWISQQTAWLPTLEGQAQSERKGLSSVRTNSDHDQESESLRELYLIIRPEEKYAVERALQSVVPPIYMTMAAIGRSGFSEPGELDPLRATSRSLFRTRQRTTFLPKTVFVLVVPTAHVNALLRAVGAALKLEGGPADCGVGFGIVTLLDEEIVIGAPRAPPEERVRAEGWSP